MGAIVNGLVLQRLARVRRRLLHLQRLHEGVDPARRDHAHPEHVRVHARLDRRRRGRPDPPADRAARDAARDAEHQRRPARGLQRDRAGLALRAARRPRRRPRSRSRARACRSGTRPACPTTRSSAAPTCSGTASGEPDLILMGTRHRGPHRPRRREAPRGRGRQGAAREHAVPGPLRRAGRRPTATACCRRRVRARVAVEAARPLGWHRWVGDAGDVVAMEGFGASAPGEVRSTSTSASRARNVAERARRVLSQLT